jgi:hypothetical protein
MSVVVAANAAGCVKRSNDPKFAPVSGRVTYHGKPLRFGIIGLQPESGQPAQCIIRADGSFTMTTIGHGAGARIGENWVRILSYEGQDPSLKQKPMSADGSPILGKSLIPEKYTSCSTSGITVDVRPGENPPLVIDLKD